MSTTPSSSSIITQGYGGGSEITAAPDLTLTIVGGVPTIGRTDVDFAEAYTLKRGATVLSTTMGSTFADSGFTGDLLTVTYSVFASNAIGDGPTSSIGIVIQTSGPLDNPLCVISAYVSDLSGVTQGILTVVTCPPTVIGSRLAANVPQTVNADSNGLIQFSGVPQGAVVQLRIPKANINTKFEVPEPTTITFTNS